MWHIGKQKIRYLHTCFFQTRGAFNCRSSSTCSNNYSTELENEFYYVCPSNIADKFDRDHINAISLEMERNLRFKCKGMPTKLSDNRWEQIISATSWVQRENLYSRFYTLEKCDKLEKIYKKLTREDTTSERELRNGELTTRDTPARGLNHFYYSDIVHKKLRKWSEFQSVKTKEYGPHMLIDWSYEHLMTKVEVEKCIKQVYAISKNTWLLPTPFNVINCNVQFDGSMMKCIRRIDNDITEDETFNFTEKSFTDLFPREKLIYLSAHADEEMVDYEHDKTYIVGAFVDLMGFQDLSADRAKSVGVRSLKLPLDRYLNWCHGKQSLPLRKVIHMISDVCSGVDWNTTLRRVSQDKTVFNAHTVKN